MFHAQANASNPKFNRNNLSEFLVTQSLPCRASIDLIPVLEAILTSRQPNEKLQCLYENQMSESKTAVLERI